MFVARGGKNRRFAEGEFCDNCASGAKSGDCGRGAVCEFREGGGAQRRLGRGAVLGARIAPWRNFRKIVRSSGESFHGAEIGGI